MELYEMPDGVGKIMLTGTPEENAHHKKMVEGRHKKFYEQCCLMNQPYIRDDDIVIQDLLNDLVAKVGEKIVVRRFVRFELGEEL